MLFCVLCVTMMYALGLMCALKCALVTMMCDIGLMCALICALCPNDVCSWTDVCSYVCSVLH